jgi:hypothetical protein
MGERILDTTAIIARLKDAAPSLGSIDAAIDIESLMASKPQPHGKPLAAVIAMGLRGSPAEVMTGAFIQKIQLTFAVILTIPSHSDRAGKSGAPDVLALITEVCTALCGWGPDDAPGAIELSRAFVVTARPGAIVYSIEFAIGDQLRIFA